MNSTNIIIPDVECMSAEQYDTLINFLNNCRYIVQEMVMIND